MYAMGAGTIVCAVGAGAISCAVARGLPYAQLGRVLHILGAVRAGATVCGCEWALLYMQRVS